MKKTQKIILSILVLALMALSTAAALAPALALTEPSTPAGLQWPTALVNPGQLTVAGSSTVAPVATEEITPPAGTMGFTAYFNNLIATSGGKVVSPTLTSDVSLAGFGSGTAVPALDYTGGVADVGEMSRPFSSTEYSVPCMADLQQWAIGVDSVAIVLSADMSWFLPYLATQGVTGLTTLQVAELFQDTSPSTTQVNQGLTTGAPGYSPLYATWGSFFTAQGWTIPSAYTTDAAATINRAARDPTSGTFDCFNNYFAVPNGYQFENKAITSTSNGQSTVVGTQEMATFTYCQENAQIQSTITASSANNYLAFISLGYLVNAGTSMIGIPIAYNTNTTPTTSGSPLIHYYGTAISVAGGEVGFPAGTANPPTWGAPVTPTEANVVWAYSGQKVTASSEWGAATGMYQAWRWLWEVTPGPVPASGPCLAAGVWIAYMMEPGTTHSGTSNFVSDASYIPLSRADMAGGTPIDSNLNTYTPVSTQSQTIPDGKVSGTDFFYFVDAYIAYYANSIYNPYADTTAQGYINGASFFGFVGAYVSYFQNYAPT